MSKPAVPPVSARPRIGRSYRLQWEAAQDAYVLLYPEGMVKLNGSAGAIMSRCDGARTLAEIVADLESTYGAAGLEADVLGFVSLALENHWLEIDERGTSGDRAEERGAPGRAEEGGADHAVRK
jgi:pyrroloquinoline quinone biosynthesis protein D